MRSPSRPEKRAISLLEEHGINELPVPVDELAIGLGADLTYEPYDGDVSGMLVRSATGPVIGVNSKHAMTRQRFTVAHEIAHLVLHKGKEVFVDDFVRVNWRNGVSSTEEIEANAFAAELLMPRDLVAAEVERAMAKRGVVTPQRLSKDLGKIFQVSPEAMGYRLENLGILNPIALIG